MGASESKLTFKEDVFRLAREDNIPARDQWWAQFYELPESAEDVFALWSPNDVRNLTLNGNDKPPPGTPVLPKKNLETLIYVCVARLQKLSSGRAHTDAPQSIVPEALNCIRILTRLLPYIYEADQLNAWEDRFFWQPQRPQQIWDTKRDRPGAYFDGLDPSRSFDDGDGQGNIQDKEIGRPLGEQLVDILIKYMFLPSFTLPKRVGSDGLPDLKAQYNIWFSGIGCRQSAGMSKENESNAGEVVRLFIALASKQLYIPPHVVADCNIKALTYITTRCDRSIGLSLICSLLNTVLKYHPAAWRVPIDMTVGVDSKTRLVQHSLQFLVTLLLYPVPDGAVNDIRKSIGRLHRVEDFQFIQQGITLVLSQPISGVSSYMPGKTVPWYPEMLILLWELLQTNKRFRSFIVETDRAHDFLVMVLYYIMDSKNEPTKQGFVRQCVLILQTLSVEPAFGKRLSKPFAGQDSLPSVVRIPNFHGSYADFLITSIHTLMTTTQGRLESVYSALLAIINNIAPHVRDLQRATSSKIVDLFVSLSSPAFLMEKDGNHQLLFSLMQAVNAILEHQYEANRRFVEVIMRSRKRFQALRDFTVEGALAELDRQAQERKDRALGEPAGIRSPIRGGSIDSLRNPTSARSPALDDVPEKGVFAIGDDDEENDDGYEESGGASFSSPRSDSNSAADDSLPLQSRNMSEKARGKQPVGHGNFSRSTSRDTSTTSLPALSTILASPPPHGQQFQPTQAWLEQWLPYLPLATILAVVDRDESGQDPSQTPLVRSTVRPSEHQIAAPPRGIEPSEPKVQAFHWTSLSLGWYISLLWGLIYASDVATNKGVNGIWTGTAIRLFNIASRNEAISLRSPKGAVDAVGHSIVQRLGSLNFGNSPTTREV